jgi:HTH-type transcriptional regulator / antitoxin HigA
VSTVNYAGKAQDRYLELILRFPLRPLRCEEDLNAAVAMIDNLLTQPSLKPEEQDYLDVLGDLVEAYETEMHPLGPVSDADLLSHLIEARGVSQSQVAGATGIAVSTISEVLRGKRTLNRDHIGRLARYFHVSPDTFAF